MLIPGNRNHADDFDWCICAKWHLWRRCECVYRAPPFLRINQHNACLCKFNDVSLFSPFRFLFSVSSEAIVVGSRNATAFAVEWIDRCNESGRPSRFGELRQLLQSTVAGQLPKWVPFLGIFCFDLEFEPEIISINWVKSSVPQYSADVECFVFRENPWLLFPSTRILFLFHRKRDEIQIEIYLLGKRGRCMGWRNDNFAESAAKKWKSELCRSNTETDFPRICVPFSRMPKSQTDSEFTFYDHT